MTVKSLSALLSILRSPFSIWIYYPGSHLDSGTLEHRLFELFESWVRAIAAWFSLRRLQPSSSQYWCWCSTLMPTFQVYQDNAPRPDLRTPDLVLIIITNRLHNIGDNVEPWGTPANIGFYSDTTPSIPTLNDLWARYEYIAFIRSPGTRICISLSKNWWF